MRKTLVFPIIFFLLALYFAPSTSAVIQQIDPEFQIIAPTNTPTPTPTTALKIAPRVKGTFSQVSGTPTNTPVPAATVTNTITPSPTPEATGVTVDDQEEPTVVGEINESKEESKKLDQKEIIGVILIGILIVIIVIQALWDKFKKPPTATSSDPE